MTKTYNGIYDYEPLWGDWRVDSEIGKGSSGKVYLVAKEEFGYLYHSVVKMVTIPGEETFREAEVLFKGDQESIETYFEDITAQMTREINIMYDLSGHGNIVNYYDHKIIKREDRFGWDVLIRMEYVTSLKQYLMQHHMSVEEVLQLGVSICSALEACENKHIIHRDIKEDNIFVDSQGNFKLGDFGVSRRAEESISAHTILGTPSYMAPEIFNGQLYDSRVDTYALGIVLYKQLNNGRLPFIPVAPEKIRFNHTEIAQQLRLNGVELKPPVHGSSQIVQIVLKACAHLPENRYESANDMKMALLEALQRNGESSILCDREDTNLIKKRFSKKVEAKSNPKVFKLAMLFCCLLAILTNLLLMTGSSHIKFDQTDEVLVFNDAKLERLVRLVTRKPQGPIHESDVTDIKRLDLSDQGLHYIEALSSFRNLQSLDLSGNAIEDGSALINMKELHDLDFSENRLKDISFVEALNQLEELSLEGNQIESIEELKFSKALKQLNLAQNSVSDIGPIKSLKQLENLDLSGNKIRGVDALSQLHNLKHLSLAENQILTLQPIELLKDLQWLDCHLNQMTNCSFIQGMTQLSYLDLSNNQIRDSEAIFSNNNLTYLDVASNNMRISDGLEHLTKLKYLDISWSQVTSIRFIQDMKDLVTLKLNHTLVSDYSDLENFDGLTTLSISDNALTKLPSLSKMTYLTHLDVQNNQLEDLDGFPTQAPLESVNLSNNKIKDISCLQSLKSLKELNISQNQITSIDALKNIPYLQVFESSQNLISDLAPIKDYDQLIKLDLSQNLIRDIDPIGKFATIKTLNLSDNKIENIASLSQMNVIWLSLTHNQIVDVSPLASVCSLKYLYLDKNPIKAYDPLQYLAPRLWQKDFE